MWVGSPSRSEASGRAGRRQRLHWFQRRGSLSMPKIQRRQGRQSKYCSLTKTSVAVSARTDPMQRFRSSLLPIKPSDTLRGTKRFGANAGRAVALSDKILEPEDETCCYKEPLRDEPNSKPIIEYLHNEHHNDHRNKDPDAVVSQLNATA